MVQSKNHLTVMKKMKRKYSNQFREKGRSELLEDREIEREAYDKKGKR